MLIILGAFFSWCFHILTFNNKSFWATFGALIAVGAECGSCLLIFAASWLRGKGIALRLVILILAVVAFCIESPALQLHLRELTAIDLETWQPGTSQIFGETALKACAQGAFGFEARIRMIEFRDWAGNR